MTLPGNSLIISAQFSEPKMLGYTGGNRVFFLLAAISLFLSIMLLLFAFSCLSSLHLASWITLFQASEAEHSIVTETKTPLCRVSSVK